MISLTECVPPFETLGIEIIRERSIEQRFFWYPRNSYIFCVSANVPYLGGSGGAGTFVFEAVGPLHCFR